MFQRCRINFIEKTEAALLGLLYDTYTPCDENGEEEMEEDERNTLRELRLTLRSVASSVFES